MMRQSSGGQKNIQRTDRGDMRVYRLSDIARIGRGDERFSREKKPAERKIK